MHDTTHQPDTTQPLPVVALLRELADLHPERQGEIARAAERVQQLFEAAELLTTEVQSGIDNVTCRAMEDADTAVSAFWGAL